MKRAIPFLSLAGIFLAPAPALADAFNPVCPAERVFYNPGDGEDIVVPRGFRVEVFAKDLNFPTDVAFLGDKHNFRVVVLESGTGLPGRCNDNTRVPGIPKFDRRNPFTPGLLILDRDGRRRESDAGKGKQRNDAIHGASSSEIPPAATLCLRRGAVNRAARLSLLRLSETFIPLS